MYLRLPVFGLLLGLRCGTDGSPAAVHTVSPALACADGEGHILVIEGSGFGPVLTAGLTDAPTLTTPSVTLRPTRSLAGGVTDAVEVTVGDGDDRLRIIGPDRLELDLDPGLGLHAAVYDVEVTATDGSRALLVDAFALADAPSITGLDPDDVCFDADPVTVTLTGQDIVVVGDDLPTVFLDGDPISPLAVTDCQPLPGDAQACTTVTVTVNPDGFPIGGLELSLENPDPIACQTALPVELTLRAAPTIDSLSPGQVCDGDTTVTVAGNGFVEGMTATLGGVEVDATVIDDQSVELTLPDGALDVGSWDLELSSPGGCNAWYEDALTVSLAPVVWAVEPPVVPLGLTVRATARITELFDEVSDVTLVHDDGTTLTPDWSWDPETPGIVGLTLPADLAAGDWSVLVDQGDGCPGIAAAAVTVSTDLVVPLDRVEAPYAWTYDYTSVDVYVDDPLPTDGAGFQAGVRAWLVDADGDNPTATLHGLSRRDELRLSGVVPLLLAPDDYDLIVVNPDGSAGWLPDALSVVESAPPTITSVSPGTLEKSSDQPVTIRGRDFRDPGVSVICRENDVETTADAVVDGWSYSSIDATIPTTLFNEAVCVVAVVNGDGTAGRYSAISITNPSQNLFPWQVGTELEEARRAPAAVGGRTTDTQRYLFAIGGDAGDASTASDTIEAAPVGVYGDLGAWRLSPRTLPEARTLAAIARVEDFVYLVGGSDGAAAVATTWRARILDPLQVPWFEGLALTTGDTGLEAGVWVYRVSALFPSDDAANPGGESLAGDRVVLTLPALAAIWQPTLSWSSVGGASGYRIYRSPSADDTPGDERWLADVTETRFTDTGDSTDGSVLPLPEGSLGMWADVATLTTPRRSPCMAQAPDPHPDPEVVYLYAAGGADADGELLDSVERLPITVESDLAQGVGEWELTDMTLSEARERCGAMAVDAAWHSVVEEGESWVYFVGGLGERNTTGAVDVARIDDGGFLVDIDTISDMRPARAGFAVAAASDFLYAFGGQNDSPSQGGVSGQLTTDDLPDVQNWNSLGTSLSVGRWLPGSAQESAVIFVVGGQSDAEDATTSTDWTNF